MLRNHSLNNANGIQYPIVTTEKRVDQGLGIMLIRPVVLVVVRCERFSISSTFMFVFSGTSRRWIWRPLLDVVLFVFKFLQWKVQNVS